MTKKKEMFYINVNNRQSQILTNCQFMVYLNFIQSKRNIFGSNSSKFCSSMMKKL